MGLLTFALNVTLDGCCDHREGVADDEMLRYWTRLMDAAGAMLFGRRTYELMEDAWPQVARDPKATPSNRDWAKKLEAKPKYVVSTTRREFPWNNTHHVEGDLTRAVKALKKATPRGLLVGSPRLSAALQRLDLVDEYRFVVHPVVAGHRPLLFSGLQPSLRLNLVAARRSGGPGNSGVRFSWFGTNGWEITFRDKTILIDPYFERDDVGFFSGKFNADAPINLRQELIDQHVKKADHILIGHGHWDH